MKKNILTMAALILFIGQSAAGAFEKDTLKKTKETGSITIGVRESSGLAYALGKGKYVGFHTEMARRIVDDISKKIGKPIKIIYQPITSENRIPLLQNGTYDFECGSTTNNKARARQADFAYTTYVEEVKVAVKKSSGIKHFSDLNGKTVVTTTGSNTVLTIRKRQRKEHMNLREIEGKDHSDSFLMLETGRADAFVMDGSILAALISRSKNPSDYIILDDTLSVEPIACMLRKNDAPLKEAINESIVRQIKDNSLKALYEQWFLKPVPPTNRIIGLPLSKINQEAWAHPNNKPMEDYPENHME